MGDGESTCSASRIPSSFALVWHRSFRVGSTCRCAGSKQFNYTTRSLSIRLVRPRGAVAIPPLNERMDRRQVTSGETIDISETLVCTVCAPSPLIVVNQPRKRVSRIFNLH
jgi:hypothetical protein